MSPTTFNERGIVEDQLATAEKHFKLALIGAALRLIDQLSPEEGVQEFSFLHSYVEEAESFVGEELPRGNLAEQWEGVLIRWEGGVDACSIRWAPLCRRFWRSWM